MPTLVTKSPAERWAFLRAAAAGLGAGLFALVLVRTAWHCDDAYITFRTVDNFVNGHGLRWNVLERVQAYTNPLWMLVIAGAYFVTREIHVTALVVSMFFSCAAVILLLTRIASTPASAVLGFAALLGSNAFIDFSTSGLENPMSAFLLAVFIALCFRLKETVPGFFALAFVASLAMLNRMDSILFFAPALAWRWWQVRGIGSTAAGFVAFLPFIAWEVFSLVYYGFLTPNTAFAKLSSGVASSALMEQGVWYYFATFSKDPVSLAVILFGLVTPILKRDIRSAVLAAGVILYLLYVVRIGGDFMQGRFFSAAVFASAAILAHARWRVHDVVFPLISFAILFGMTPYPAAIQGENCGQERWGSGANPPSAPFVDARFVKDQRGHDYPFTGLLRLRHTDWEIDYNWAREGRKYREADRFLVRVHGAIGWKGWYAGPKAFIIDYYALSDPLLARLPAADPQNWKIGHIRRAVPEGYVESIEQGKNLIVDPGVAAYYDKLLLITRGELWSSERWQAIIGMNLGRYEPLLEDYREKYLDGRG